MDGFDGLGAAQSLGSGVGTTGSWRTLAIVGDQAASEREARKKFGVETGSISGSCYRGNK